MSGDIVLEEDEDMDSQLNPDAKEFVPTSPQRTTPLSPFSNGTGASIINNRPDLLDDDVVSQSPRKGVTPLMDDIVLPSENDFSEISKRPSELLASPTELANGHIGNIDIANGNGNIDVTVTHRPGSSSSQCSYQEMNLKEAMHGDEKQELAAEVPIDTSEINLGLEQTNENEQISSNTDEHTEVYMRSLREQDPMNISFYNDGTETGSFQTNPFSADVDLNAVTQLPNDSEDDSDKENLNGFAVQDVAAETVISQVVHEMATEVTSILNEFEEHHESAVKTPEPAHFNISTEPPTEQLQIDEDVINKSDLSANASEFNPSESQISAAEADYSVHSRLDNESFGDYRSIEISFAPKPVEIALEPEPIQEQHVEPIVNFVAESIAQEPPANENNIELVAAASVTALTVAAAAAANLATEKSDSPKGVKSIDAKKPEVKGRVGTAPAKKPLTTAPLKTLAKTSTLTARSSPTKTIAPKVTSRTVPLTKAPIEKKIATTTSTNAIKKPLSNGVASTAIKKTTTTTVTKTTSGVTKSSVATTKTTTARPISSTASTKATALSKPATTTTARVPLSAR